MSRLPLLLAAALLIVWSAGASAQTEPSPPPLPQAFPPLPETVQSGAPQSDAPQNDAMTLAFPALPLGSDGVRDVQSQLIALGFNPGPADGQAGPATVAAAQQYNEDRGNTGPVPIDGVLLTRLQQDTGPRLTPDQVAARSPPRYRAQAPANPLVGALQRFDRNLRGLFSGGR